MGRDLRKNLSLPIGRDVASTNSCTGTGYILHPRYVSPSALHSKLRPVLRFRLINFIFILDSDENAGCSGG